MLFKKSGWIYIPTSPVGIGIAGAAIIFMVQTFMAIDSNSHSASDTLYGWYPFAVCTFLGYHWLAGNLANRAKN